MNEKINKQDVKPKEGPCGLLRELYNSENLSIAHLIVLGEARKHMHKKMEEVYYIEKGVGKLVIDGKVLDIRRGDVVSIPKNTWHHLKKSGERPLEVLVITSPRFDLNDVILGD